MRVLVVAPYPPRRCGIGAYARDQVARLRAQGHDVTVLSPPDGDGDVTVPFFGGRPFVRAARMGRRFDRVVVHFQPALYFRPRRPLSKVLTSLGLLTLASTAGHRLDLLVHEADQPVRWRPDYLLLGLAFRLAHRVTFHTEAERGALERHYGVRVRAAVVPHRVDPVEVVGRDRARADLGVPPQGGTTFVCAGFLQPAKGFERALAAFDRARPEGARMYVVGSVREPTAENTAYAAALAERARSIPGAELVERPLSDREFDRWVAAADWLVLPYVRSWSSGVLARAQALGTPAIVTDVGGLGEQAGEHDVVVHDDADLERAIGAAAVTAGRSPARPAPRPGSEMDPSARPKKGRGVLIGLILISVLLAAVAQLTLKHGMNQVTGRGAVPLSLGRPAETARRVATNVAVWGGLAIFVASAAVWLIVLSRVSLSFAYPFASLTYVLILVFDRFALNQPVSGLRYAGVALIVAGLVLISRTHQTL